MRWLLSLVVLAGCQQLPQPDVEQVSTAVAVAESESLANVIPWEGELPLQGPADEEKPTDLTPSGSSSSDPEEKPYVAGIEAECEEEPRDAGSRQVAADRIRWWAWSTKNLQLAKKSTKPIFCYLYSDNCRYCVKLEREVFTDKRVIVAVNRDFTPIKINASRHTNIAKRWKVKGFPCNVLVWPSNQTEIYREPGYLPVNEYLGLLRRFEAKAADYRSKLVVSYPIRSRWWTGCSSWKHLAYASVHRGKFDDAWLRDLSWAELQSLHSDDHENRVHWAAVVRP